MNVSLTEPFVHYRKKVEILLEEDPGSRETFSVFWGY